MTQQVLFQFTASSLPQASEGATGRGKVFQDETGAVWWDPETGKPPELLADKESLCGVYPFETGFDDVFRDCCSRHDHFYVNRAKFEAWGFDRKWMDDQFLTYMLEKATGNPLLRARAQVYYNFARMFGWMLYYKHPGASKAEQGVADLYNTMREGLKIAPKKPTRSYGWKRDIPDQRDKLFSSVVSFKESLPRQVNLKDGIGAILDQGALGSCVYHAYANALIYVQRELLKEQHQVNEEFLGDLFLPSRLFMYYNARVEMNTVDVDSGSSIRDGIKVLKKYGVCPEGYWGYDRDFRVKPSTEAYEAAVKHQITSYLRMQNLQELKQCLARGYPVVFGFSVYESFESQAVEATGIVPHPKGRERMLGGHAVLAVGYDDTTQRLICANSWGESWGDKGFMYLPYSFVTSGLADDFWAVTRIRLPHEQ